MRNQPRGRKRIHALPRAPDGSAFQNCDKCGLSVAISLADMHQCQKVKKFKVVDVIDQNVAVFTSPSSLVDQPRSPFRFFMEEFVKTCGVAELIDIDRKGIGTWRNMSEEERDPYVKKAEVVNSAYHKCLIQEIEDMSWVNDEADSATVGKFDQSYGDFRYCDDYDSSDGSGLVGFESLNTSEWERVKPWVVESSD